MKKLYLETYGCQMNFSDSDVVFEILKSNFELCNDIAVADLILVNTCSIRENAETRVFGRLDEYNKYKKKNKNLVVGILGCMAERLKENLLENRAVDMVVGPDSYRELPRLINEVYKNKSSIDIELSDSETYDKIFKTIFTENKISEFVSIMRGCNNFCSYCIVPYVRGRERSKSTVAIIEEIENLVVNGIKEVTLLGQNVNSYNFKLDDKVIKFDKLLELIAIKFPNTRIRFATPHPKDMTDETIMTIAKYENICKYIHLPLQAGSTKVLKLMKRGYTREWYMNRVEAIKKYIPDCGISTDIIAGFCDETEADFQETMEVVRTVRFDSAFMFHYSNREGTYADANLKDNIPLDVKKRRLQDVIDLQRKISLEENTKDIGRVFEVLIEGFSKKSNNDYIGKNSQNKAVIFPVEHYKIGDLVNVKILKTTSAALLGKVVKN